MKRMEKYYEEYWADPKKAPPNNDTTTSRRVQLLLETVGRGKRILDVGCGDGLITSKMSDNGNNVTGMDISRRALGEAERKYPRIKFVRASAEERYPFEDKEFDVLFAGDIIEHIADTWTALSEMHRVLKKKGILVLSTPIHNVIKNVILCFYGFSKHFDPTGPHLRFFTMKSLETLLDECGFRIVKIKYIGRFWPVNKGIIVIAEKR